MTLTISNWTIVGFVFILGIALGIWGIMDGRHYQTKSKIPAIIIAATIAITVGLVFVFNWYNTSTASGIRGYKDFESEMSNGIERTIVITAEDGREIFKYSGKVDLDMDNEGNYLRFETQDGKRYTIEYGVQDSVIVVEK